MYVHFTGHNVHLITLIPCVPYFNFTKHNAYHSLFVKVPSKIVFAPHHQSSNSALDEVHRWVFSVHRASNAVNVPMGFLRNAGLICGLDKYIWVLNQRYWGISINPLRHLVSVAIWYIPPKPILNSNVTRCFHPQYLYHFLNSFETMSIAWHCYCHAMCKFIKRLDIWWCYGQMKFTSLNLRLLSRGCSVSQHPPLPLVISPQITVIPYIYMYIYMCVYSSINKFRTVVTSVREKSCYHSLATATEFIFPH